MDDVAMAEAMGLEPGEWRRARERLGTVVAGARKRWALDLAKTIRARSEAKTIAAGEQDRADRAASPWVRAVEEALRQPVVAKADEP